MNDKILLVDDDERILNSFSRLLQKRGFTVKTALSGTEALTMVKLFFPDVIVSDMRMHEMDGVELMKKIPEVNGYLPGKIIFTAFDDGEAINLSMIGDGGVFRVEKDRWETDLVATVIRALELSKLRLKAWNLGNKNAMQKEELSRLKFIKSLATSLGHEINNPLQSITAANEIIGTQAGKNKYNEAITTNIAKIKDVTRKFSEMKEIRIIKYPGEESGMLA